ncbi:hypothetical protein CAMSH0001_0985 [Campylobacter showae RM3277]|uniref:Uncharacterized protein n=1 Tax=Campylobacter showae RM3277 TaxID=553219 RepID=C6REQ2_9BACT|nr:hypothetical protein CAMSH0001_0985 [Campylobacter showae RM3277]
MAGYKSVIKKISTMPPKKKAINFLPPNDVLNLQNHGLV